MDRLVSAKALADDGGAAAWRALCDLRVREAAGTGGTDVDRAITRLTWRLAQHGRCADLPARSALLRSALGAAGRIGRSEDAMWVYLLLFNELVAQGASSADKNAVLEKAVAVRDGPMRASALLALARRLLTDQDDFAEVLWLLAQAEEEVDPVALADSADLLLRMRIDLAETRARANLALGCLDVAAPDVAAAAEHAAADTAGEVYRRRINFLQIQFAFIAEDYRTVVDLHESLAGAAWNPAEARRFVALARWRLREVTTAQALALLDAAWPTTAAQSADVAIRHLTTAAMLCVDVGDVERARASVAAAQELLVRHGLGRNLWVRAHVAVQRANVALATSPPGDDLRAIRAELAGVADALTELWHSVPPRSGGIGFLNLPERRNVYSALIRVERVLQPHAPAAALAPLLSLQAEGALARRLGLRPVKLGTVQRELIPANGGILVFLPAYVGSHVFAITRTAVVHRELPGQDAMHRDVVELRRGILDADSDCTALRKIGFRIRDWLLPADLAASVRQWSSCGILGRDLLYDLPFEALPGFDLDWLGIEKDLWYVPALPILVRCRARLPTPLAVSEVRAALLAATGPVGAGNERAELAIPDAALAPVVRPWGAGVVLLSGSAAGTAAMSRPEVRTAGIVHIVAHGARALPNSDGVPTGGFLAHDGIVTCDAVERLVDAHPSCAPLAVLSICGSAVGSPRRGEDTGSHVAGAFLRAGAGAVVAADTDIQAGAALVFAAALHRHLAAGHTVAGALRQARADLAAEPPFAHPVHHAVMAVWGWGELKIAVPASPSPRPLVVGVVVGAALASWLVVRRSRRRAPFENQPGPTGGGSVGGGGTTGTSPPP